MAIGLPLDLETTADLLIETLRKISIHQSKSTLSAKETFFAIHRNSQNQRIAVLVTFDIMLNVHTNQCCIDSVCLLPRH